MCLQRNVVLDEENRFGEYLALSADVGEGGERRDDVSERKVGFVKRKIIEGCLYGSSVTSPHKLEGDCEEAYPKIIVPERGPDPERLSPKVPDRRVVYGPDISGENVDYDPIKK